MGKIGNAFIIISLLLCISLKSQILQINYALQYKPNQHNEKLVLEEKFLEINTQNNTSNFFSHPLMYDDAKKESFYISAFSKNQSITELIPVSYSWYAVEREVMQNWNISSEKSIVLNHECKKASITYGGRNWTAWFAGGIQLPYGPYLFGNLPGLILKVESEDGDYKFEATELINKNNTTPLPNFRLMNEAAWNRLLIAAEKDPSTFFHEKNNRMNSNDLKVEISFDGKKISQRDLENSFIEKENAWKAEHNNPIFKGVYWPSPY